MGSDYRKQAEELIEFSAGFFGSEKVINHFRSMIETALRQVAEDARKEEREGVNSVLAECFTVMNWQASQENRSFCGGLKKSDAECLTDVYALLARLHEKIRNRSTQENEG